MSANVIFLSIVVIVQGFCLIRTKNAIPVTIHETVEDTNKKWQVSLVEKGYAEYSRKTGEWFLREPKDISADVELMQPLPNLLNTRKGNR